MKSLIFVLLFSSALFLFTDDLDGYCGYDHVHYDTIEQAHQNNTKIIGCGPCGACSNEHVIFIGKQKII